MFEVVLLESSHSSRDAAQNMPHFAVLEAFLDLRALVDFLGEGPDGVFP